MHIFRFCDNILIQCLHHNIPHCFLYRIYLKHSIQTTSKLHKVLFHRTQSLSLKRHTRHFFCWSDCNGNNRMLTSLSLLNVLTKKTFEEIQSIVQSIVLHRKHLYFTHHLTEGSNVIGSPQHDGFCSDIWWLSK